MWLISSFINHNKYFDKMGADSAAANKLQIRTVSRELISPGNNNN